jgi:pyrimidine deaminase RibD-like protein
MIIQEILTAPSNDPREELDSILAKCCEAVLDGQAADSEFYGMVGACVVCPDGQLVYGVNYQAEDGRRVHAERAALERCDNVSSECVVVTTLSPCNRPMDERSGESCEDLLAEYGIKHVYCGYKDPTQEGDDSIETCNEKLRELCKRLADTFLDEARKKKRKSRGGGYFFPGYGYYGGGVGSSEGGDGGGGESKSGIAEGQHQHTEIIKWPVGDWIVYLDNHSVIRAMTRNIGPRMMSNLLNMVSIIPNLEDKVPKNGAFWIQDIKTNSSFYFRRLDIPSEPLAVRCETGVQDVPRANKNTPVFRVNAYTGPETPKDIQGMKQAKLRSKFVGTNVMASNLATNIQKGHLGSNDVIRNPATQDSKRYDRAFKQAQQMDKEVDENFADGKVKGKSRPGRVKRSGASCNGSVTSLRAKAKNASGERAKMYHWCANMKSGKKK